MADATCAICLTEVSNRSALECGHIFHLRCIEQWNKQTCPMCRKPHQIPIKCPAAPTIIDDYLDDDIPDFIIPNLLNLIFQ